MDAGRFVHPTLRPAQRRMTCALSLAGLPNSPRLDAVCASCREVDWWWPMNEAVVLTDRPTVMSRDTSGRLHDADGPALAYADSYTFTCYDRRCRRVSVQASIRSPAARCTQIPHKAEGGRAHKWHGSQRGDQRALGANEGPTA